MMDFGDVILRTLFPSFMAIQACIQLYFLSTALQYMCLITRDLLDNSIHQASTTTTLGRFVSHDTHPQQTVEI